MHPDFKAALFAAGIVSFCCFAMAVLGLFAPEFLGWNADTGYVTKVVLVMLLLSPRFLFYPAWKFNKEIIRAYREGESASMVLSLEAEKSDAPHVTATLRRPRERGHTVRIQLVSRKGKIANLGDGEIEATVFYGAEKGDPLLIEANNLKLWSARAA